MASHDHFCFPPVAEQSSPVFSSAREVAMPTTPRERGRRGGVNWRIRAGFTLVEIMIVVAIIGILGAIAIPAIRHAVERARVGRAIADIRAIATELDIHDMENGRPPDSLAAIGRDTLRDPWGNPYQYLSFAAAGRNWRGRARKDHSLVPINSTYDLYSMGRDGASASPLTARASRDDVVRANDGGFIGLASEF